MKRIAAAIARLVGRAANSVMITDTSQARHQRKMARVQGPGGGGQDPAVGVAADTANTQISSGMW